MGVNLQDAPRDSRVDAVNRPPGRIRYGWTLSLSDWRAVPTEVLKSDGWQSRALSHSLKPSIPQQAGVYVMCVRPPNVSEAAEPFLRLVDVIYVGKTSNLRNRYSQHLNVPSPKVRAARNTYSDSLRFWYLHLTPESISAVESILITCFGPAANDRPGEIQKLVVGMQRMAQSTELTQEV